MDDRMKNGKLKRGVRGLPGSNVRSTLVIQHVTSAEYD